MPEMSQAIYELSKVQAEVAQALIRAAHAAVEAIPDIDPDLLDEYAETPIEELLRGMLAAKERPMWTVTRPPLTGPKSPGSSPWSAALNSPRW